jgi:hypothetical protein
MSTQLSQRSAFGAAARRAVEFLLPRLFILAAVIAMHGAGLMYVHETDAAQVLDSAAAPPAAATPSLQCLRGNAPLQSEPQA